MSTCRAGRPRVVGRRVGVIGGGVAGIAVTKALVARGVEVEAYERSDRLGGVWSNGNPYDEVTAAYDTLTLNSSKRTTQFPDHPMPDHYPDYPSGVQVEDYLNDYADRFGVRQRYRFETTVERAARRGDGGWDLCLSTGERRRYDLLVAANGHHHTPNVPAFPGEFHGTVMHSHGYRRREELRGRDVVVLGLGNSAMDVAAEAAKVARTTTLAARRGTYVLPKYLFGIPLDRLPNDPRVPFAIRRRLLAGLIRLGHGRMRDFGLPDPDHPLGGSHPTVSQEIFAQLKAGRITVKPNIARYDGDGVEFVDGSRVRADLVVLATGYRIVFPFLDEDVLSAPDNRVELYLNVFDPRYDDLAVLGLVQTVGSNIRMAHAQAQLVGDWATGRYALPRPEVMRREIAANTAAIRRRYVASPRHTLQVDHHEYLRRLDRERREGAERAGPVTSPR
ncbi:NADPH-dependent L-lysine N(6)-monooxygenase [Nitriliruptoraceae bacterium ZYF776]|nr:NADPH-dependent L-lysine N(6)-monooxygenase [Profundirhabdus halotolerans]